MKNQCQLNALYFLSDVAIAKTSFFTFFYFTTLCCSTWLYHSDLTIPAVREGEFAQSFSFTLQYTVQMLLYTSLQLPLHGKWSTAASGKSWCKCRRYSKGIKLNEYFRKKYFQKPAFPLPRHLYLNKFLFFYSLPSERSLWILIISEGLR